jgi:hypothetical protein
LTEAAPIAAVRDFAEKQQAAGADVKLFEYEGAHHACDSPDFRTPAVARIGTVSFTVHYHPQAHARVKGREGDAGRGLREAVMQTTGHGASNDGCRYDFTGAHDRESLALSLWGAGSSR